MPARCTPRPGLASRPLRPRGPQRYYRTSRARLANSRLGLWIGTAAALLLTACAAGEDRPAEPTRSQASIAASFDRSKYEIYRIYSNRLRVRPGLAGRTVFRFTVDTYGKVSQCEVLESTLDDSEVENAVIRIISGMDFGSAWPPGDVTVSYPIQFVPTTPTEPGPP